MDGYTSPSNYGFDMTSEGQHLFAKALSLALLGAGYVCASHYKISPEHGLVLYWMKSSDPDVSALPFQMGGDVLQSWAWEWLTNHAKYPKCPDFDGSASEGWRIYNEDWGYVGGDFYAFVAIKPEWAMYGK